MDALCITKLDILDELDEVSACVAYEINGSESQEFPACASDQENCRPVLKTFTGWKSNTYGTRKPAELPAGARRYLDFVEEFLQTPIAMLSTSPERDDTIFFPAFDTICERS